MVGFATSARWTTPPRQRSSGGGRLLAWALLVHRPPPRRNVGFLYKTPRSALPGRCGCRRAAAGTGNESVIGGRHPHGMADTAASDPRPRLEMSVVQARTRFVQLVRLAGLTEQCTVITDGGRALAAIVPVSGVPSLDTGASQAAAGWVRRIETLRQDFRRQHREMERALDDVWRELDKLRPPGSDRAVDALRAAHAGIRRPG